MFGLHIKADLSIAGAMSDVQVPMATLNPSGIVQKHFSTEFFRMKNLFSKAEDGGDSNVEPALNNNFVQWQQFLIPPADEPDA